MVEVSRTDQGVAEGATVVSGARVDIRTTATGDVVDHCYGPTLAGRCPRADQDGSVPCKGRRIAPLGAGPEFWLLWVPPTSRRCPLSGIQQETGY
jgi:hypothetical protein